MNKKALPVHSAWIGLGSNLGDRRHTLEQAWVQIGTEKHISRQRLSTCYRSRPVDMASSNWFVNAVGELQTTLPPLALLEVLQRVENQFGRRRDPSAAGYQDRTLDLDLLLYDTLTLNLPRLQIPHPQMHNRLFVLTPLAELIPDMKHPLLGLSMVDLKNHLLEQPGTASAQQLYPVSAGTGRKM